MQWRGRGGRDRSGPCISIRGGDRTKLSVVGLVVTGTLLTSAGGVFAQDAAKSETMFRKCMACHRAGEGAKNLVGPVLNGIIGRAAEAAEGYAYSQLNKAAGENGLIGTEDLIVSYLQDPNDFLKKIPDGEGQGRTRNRFYRDGLQAGAGS